MPSYRLCFVNRKSGEVIYRYEFNSADDGAAETFAAVWSEEAPMELWRGGLRLRRWDSEQRRVSSG